MDECNVMLYIIANPANSYLNYINLNTYTKRLSVREFIRQENGKSSEIFSKVARQERF